MAVSLLFNGVKLKLDDVNVNKRQRILNRASNTIVIKLKANNVVRDHVEYLKG